MKNYINLFEILGEKGDYGLIQYLKEKDDTELKVLAKQHSIKGKMKDRDEIIKSILFKMETALNRGKVFDDRKSKTALVVLYE